MTLANQQGLNKKLSVRREAARCFVSLNISLSHARSLKVIRNDTVRQIAYEFLLAYTFHSNYGNSIFVGTSVYLQDRLQSVLNAAARLVYSRRTSEHTTPLLRELRWLRVPERIQFRLCVLAYHCVHGTAPAYLSDIRDRRSSMSPLC